ncbi:hypothetical protein BOX15_Mlig009147g1, partial [Macrostomum lignano]
RRRLAVSSAAANPRFQVPNLQASSPGLIAFAVSVGLATLLTVWPAVSQCSTGANHSMLKGHRFRSSWARAAYHKMQFDTEHLSENSRHLEWYRLEQPQLLPKELADAFVQLEQDAETEAFLANSYAKSERLLTQLYHRVAKPLLCMFMSVTSANGFLRRGSMFVLSGEQFRRLIVGSDSGDHQQQQEPLFDSLLDLGAGDGNVTSHYAGYFRRVFATEMATVMTWRLAERGYTVVDPITWLPTQPATDAEPELDAHYDLIGCFNLLDRCEAPLDLLAQAKRRLRPGSGRLLLAIVVPVRQFCEFAPGNRPAQVLAVSGPTFEEQLASLVSNVLRPQGWAVERWAKAPYLCEGDLYQSFYHLTDAVLLLRPAD